MARPSGRRPGASRTKDAIADAARHQFAEHGYDRASLRGIAAEAGVDPALISHYFGSKRGLFVEVSLPFEPREALPPLLAGDRSSVGERVIRFVLAVLEDEESRSGIIGLIRAGASEPEAARLIRERIANDFVSQIAEELDVDQPRLRGALVNSQIIGLVMSRYIVGVEPLASATPDEVAAALGPVLQRYLAEPLGAG
jgi:AcrR family transcriptional regulator